MVICSADPSLKEVALIFDDGPNPEVTPKLLAVLKHKQIVANFFLIGARAEEYPQITRQIAKDGHEVGNHTYTHKRLAHMLEENGEQAVLEEVKKGDAAIRDTTGLADDRPMFFRPPYLEWSQQLSKLVFPIYQDRIMVADTLISDWNWGKDHHWNGQDTTAIHEQAEKIFKVWRDAIKNGTILAFHDSAEYNLLGNKHSETWMDRALPTLEAIPQIIDYFISEGFAIKKLSEMKLIHAKEV